MAEKPPTPQTPPAVLEGPKTLTIAIDDLDALIDQRAKARVDAAVEAALAARAPAPVPAPAVVVTTDQAAAASARQAPPFRFVPGVGWTNVPEGHDPVTGRPR